MLSKRRLKEWHKVVKVSKPSIFGWVKMIFGLLSLLLGKKISPITWRKRMNACYMCPVYDPVWKRCRPYNNSELGCGCYTPYSNMVGKECWGRKTQGAPFGWGEEHGE